MKRLALGLVIFGVLAWLAIAAVMLFELAIPSQTIPTAPPQEILVLPTASPTTIPSKTATASPVPTATAVPSRTPFVIPPTSTFPTVTAVPPTPIPPTPTAGSPTVSPIPLNLTPATALSPASAAVPSGSAAPSSGAPGADCPPPDGWIPYSVTEGDTLFGFQLGANGQATVADIMKANCLTSKLLTLGQNLYLPPGAAANAPKVDTSSGGDGTPLPAGQSRTPRCPCTIMFRPGLRLEQIAVAIDQILVGFSGADFLAVTSARAQVSGFDFLNGRPASASLEGFMYPGTYTLQNSTTAQDFRDQLLHAFDAAVPGDLRTAAGARSLSFYQVVVFASILRRESAAPEEQVKIASTWYNLMAIRNRLASDATVQYVVGRPGNWWPRLRASDFKIDSPFNTYMRVGLPPAPISNPDVSTIRSALFPAQTDYMYFAASCDGPGNHYTRTFQELLDYLRQCGR